LAKILAKRIKGPLARVINKRQSALL